MSTQSQLAQVYVSCISFVYLPQVGLAFLAGLAFAIILVPINRWLAIKIGQLSSAMMQQKDNRVKVVIVLGKGYSEHLLTHRLGPASTLY